MRIYLILFCLCLGGLLRGQSDLPEFGKFSTDEINLKACSFDKNAEAVILLDEAVSDYDDDYHLITRRRVRIKIFHQREVDRGNIRIRFYSKDKFEFITGVRGVTYNMEGGYPLSYLENKSIFTEKEDNFYSSTKFAMPNVKPGSIIEYEYTSNMEHYGGLSEWVFQHDIPTLKSCYLLSIRPNTEFQYSVQKKADYPIIIKPMSEQGKMYYEMNNVPGLKFEPFMDAPRDYLQKVEFQLAEIVFRSGGSRKISQTWKDLAYDLLSEREFGGALKKSPKIDELTILVAKETSAAGKLNTIYNYTRNRFTWNGYYSKYASDGFKNLLEKRTGNAGEINLLLINLLQSFDIEVYPLLVAERDFGRIDTTYPFVDRFNKVVAYARVDDTRFVLDATEKYTPPGLTPYPLLNTIAFVVDKKNYRLIRLLSNKDAFSNTIKLNAVTNRNGLLKGTAEIMSNGYAKEVRTEQIREDQKKFIKETLEEGGTGLSVDNFTFENLDDDNKPLVQKMEFEDDLNASGGFIFLPVNLFTGLVKNPFTAEQRFTNVNFGYPYDITLQATIQLPEKSRIETLPPDKTVSLGSKSFTASRSLKTENNSLVVTVSYKQTTTLVLNDQYASLRFIYKQITDFLNEPVVIKLVN